MKRLIILIFVLSLAISRTVAQPEPLPESRIYEIKWRSARDIAGILSGIFLVLAISDTYNAMTIQARPEQHPLVQELIRKYDVPAKTIEFQFHMLRASRDGQGIKNGLPEHIQRVLKEVASLTKYDSFELVDTPMLRATEGKNARVSGKGTFYYHLIVGHPTIVKSDPNKELIRVDEFAINFEIPEGRDEKGPIFKTVGVQTSFTIQDGETIVLGASQIQQEVIVRQAGFQKIGAGEAIVTVVTANVLH